MDPQRQKREWTWGKSMNQFFCSRADAHSREKRRRNEKKRKGGGRDKIPRVKRAPVVNIVGISLLFFQKFMFSLDGPLLFCDKKTEQRHLTIEIESASSKNFLNTTFQIDFNRAEFFFIP